MITFYGCFGRTAPVWFILWLFVPVPARRAGFLPTHTDGGGGAAPTAGSPGLRLYVDERNTRAQKVYKALGMNGDHYRVFEAMFEEPQAADGGAAT
jgi:hypothetical protein